MSWGQRVRLESLQVDFCSLVFVDTNLRFYHHQFFTFDTKVKRESGRMWLGAANVLVCKQNVASSYPWTWHWYYLLTQTSPHEGKQQREHDVAPVPLVFCCYRDNPEKEEDEGLGDGAKHLDHVANGCAGTLGNIFLHVVFHGEGTGNNAAGKHTFGCYFFPYSCRIVKYLFSNLLTPWWMRWRRARPPNRPGSCTWIWRVARFLGPWRWTSWWRRPRSRREGQSPSHQTRPRRTLPRRGTRPLAPPLACPPQSWTCCTTPENACTH